MASVVVKGDYSKTENFLKNLDKQTYTRVFEKYGELGVQALADATPKRTGKTAASWTYRIERSRWRVSLIFENTNVVNYVNIAIILQTGHGTRNGGYVRGIDYINPAIQPIFEKLAKDAWEEVKNS